MAEAREMVEVASWVGEVAAREEVKEAAQEVQAAQAVGR